MSFPDPTQPPHPYMQPPFGGGGDDGDGFWPQFLMENEHRQQQEEVDLIPQLDNHPPFKRPRTSEKPPNYSPFPQRNPRVNPPNVPGSKGTSHIFYKTRICAKFMEGSCRNGEHCTFAHGVEDLHEPPPNWQELVREKDRRAGSGGSSWGDDQRMMPRMKICKKYYNGEECLYGEKCNFLHERRPPPMKKFKVDMPGQRESSAISIGITGDGKGSSSDFDQSVIWKTKLCSKWEMGQCPFGERCHFAHGQSELKSACVLDEVAEMGMNAICVPRKSSSVSAHSTTPADLVVAAPLNAEGEQKITSKWKSTKKINRIYADWLDDLTPPHCSPNGEEMT